MSTVNEAFKQHRAWALGVLASACVVGGVIGLLISGNRKDIDILRESQVTACKESLEPGGVRFIMAEQIRAQIAQSHTIPARFFPNIPPKVFKRLVREQNVRRNVQIAELLSIDCVKQYGG